MPIGYEKVYENKFTTPTESFTIQDLSDYGLLHILFSFDLQHPPLRIIVSYCTLTVTQGQIIRVFSFYGRSVPTHPLQGCGHPLEGSLHTKPTGAHTHFTYNHAHYGYASGYWKNTEDPINNIQPAWVGTGGHGLKRTIYKPNYI